jgi:hypothetical protein
MCFCFSLRIIYNHVTGAGGAYVHVILLWHETAVVVRTIATVSTTITHFVTGHLYLSE